MDALRVRFTLVALVAFAAPNAAADPLADAQSWLGAELPKGLSVVFYDNIRWEVEDFFDPGPRGGDPGYDFFGDRLRFGLRYDNDRIGAEGILQYTQLWQLPDHATGTPGGILGPGASYFVTNGGDRAPGHVYAKYLDLRWKKAFGEPLTFTAGRFGYSSGNERVSGNAKIDFIKSFRIADRLIGEFGWSQFQRSFDGFRGDWDHRYGRLSAAAMRPTQGGFESQAGIEMTDIDIVNVAQTFKPDLILPAAEIQLFFDYYRDARPVRARVDNTGLPAPVRQDQRTYTGGGHLVGVQDLGPGQLDYLLWGAVQGGEWFDEKQFSGAAALEGGYQLANVAWKPWLRAGFDWGSGDGNPHDGEHNTFAQLIPTARLYSYSTLYNLQNTRDAFIQLLLQPVAALSLRADLHLLGLSNRADGWYQGGGPTREHGTLFGFSSRPSGGQSDLLTVAELTAQWQVTPTLLLHGYYGHAWGHDVVRANFSDGQSADYLFLEVTFNFTATGK